MIDYPRKNGYSIGVMANSNITKKALADTLMKLGTTKDLNKITVSDIVEECGVNRQTFYYHFADKYELLKYIYETELFDPLMEDLSFENWEPKMIEALKVIKRMRDFFMNTVASSPNFFQGYMQKTLFGVFCAAVDDLDTYNQVSNETKELYARFLTYGTSGVILNWIMDGAKQKEEELVQELKGMFLKTEEIQITKILNQTK